MAKRINAKTTEVNSSHVPFISHPKEVTKNQDSGTNDLLVSQVLRTNETQVWFLAEHLVDTPLVRS